LQALAWVPRVVIIDSFSTDRTVELARGAHPNVQVVQRSFDTHAAQWNFGLDHVRTSWVLALDADYQLPLEFAGELSGIEPIVNVTGYEAEFVYCVFGRPLRATLYPPHTVLFRKEQGRYIDEGHTQVLQLSGNVQRLRSRILHDDRKPLSRWIGAQDRYSIIEARHLLIARREQLSAPDRLRKRIFFAPTAVFLYLLFGKGLFLDGWRGWYYICQRTIAEILLSLRLLTEREGLENRRNPIEPAG
jgi:glycosyltransferase involved in cell wall biosynthesis